LAHIEELAKLLKHKDPEMRRRAAKSLQVLEDSRATEPLMEALGSRHFHRVT
jgi:HEAT repeat protein